jgi:hypothetical protein
MKKNDKTELIDLSEVLKDQEGKWVVLSMDNKRLLASGDTVEEIKGKLSKGIAMKVPDFSGPYVP